MINRHILRPPPIVVSRHWLNPVSGAKETLFKLDYNGAGELRIDLLWNFACQIFAVVI